MEIISDTYQLFISYVNLTFSIIDTSLIITSSRIGAKILLSIHLSINKHEITFPAT